MTLQLPHVRPGDVISAAFMNTLIDQLIDMDGRLLKLESVGTSQVVINDIIPATPVRVGDDLEILGSHFDFSAGAQRVYFNSTRATVFRSGSSDMRLIVQVPNVPNLPLGGGAVTLLVTNVSSSTSRSITVLPVAQQGNVFVSWQNITPAVVNPGMNVPIVISYKADCQTFLPSQITITPTISVANWQPLLAITDASGRVLPDGVLPVTPGQQSGFAITLPAQLPNPVGGATTSFSLSVGITGPAIAGSQDGPRTFQIGTTNNPPDPSITLSFNLALPSSAVTGNVIHGSLNQAVTVSLRSVFTQDGSYSVTPSLAGGAANWTVSPTSNALFPDKSPLVIANSGPAAPITRFPTFDVTQQAGATPGQLVVTVQRANASSNQTATFSLQPS
jgi:hypothetical protein